MNNDADKIAEMLKAFQLPIAAETLTARLTAEGHEAALATLREVLEEEHEARHARRVARLRSESKLPLGKTFDTFKLGRLPPRLSRAIQELCNGEFLLRNANILAFGLPGTGKSHIACAIAHELIARGHSVYFTPTFRLVQELLAAKRDLALPQALRKLDRFELLVLDDIGYVKQGPDEIEVLFTLLAERYERRSILITSNLVFKDWDRIFQNPMTTVAAIDRLVHHSAILEFDVPSYRAEEGQSGVERPTEPGDLSPAGGS